MLCRNGRILGLELVSPQNSKRLRCSIAVFVCWAFVVASGLTFFIFHFALAKQAIRLDLDLPLPRYLWDIAKSTTRAERLSCAAAIVVLAVCIILIVYFTVVSKKHANAVVDVAPHEWYITKKMWLAPKFINDEKTEFTPVKLIIIAHTVSPECNLFVNCAAEMVNLQNYFTTHYGYDLPYNFVIGNEGRVYEGRSWEIIGAHTSGYNRCSLGLAFIGDYREGLPSYSKVTSLQLQRAQMLLDKGVELGYIDKDYQVVGAKDLASSYSPGTNLYREIQKWPHYAHNNTFRGKTCEEIYNRALPHTTTSTPRTVEINETTTLL
ncbi:peptidoglycan-recognition protein 3 isoform X3 [Spodoptera frugiperda]|uniref:Peptidoglycan recognition protein n=1 Tax=Spodoptera frugiperda TaxID=7108 RepID=A0A9R0EEU9_SPOFR|nr:peptidoglycan-recognition protein 3 isoform X3 [Spodoptera frugiperda]